MAPRIALAAMALALALPARALNHDTVVAPLPAGPFAVACSNIAQDASLIAPGASATDYWEGRPVDGVDHYVDQILADPAAVVQFDALVPDIRSLYPGHAGDPVAFVAIVCYPTSRSNADPDYILPQTGEAIPHMQLPGDAPKLISASEYAVAFGTHLDPAAQFPARLPLIVYSHGLTGSPISSGYVEVMVQLAAHGFMVAAPFHGDPRFSRVRIEDISDFFYLLRDFDRVVELQLMRPVALKAMTDYLLADPGFAPGIDTQRIGGFGASMGGEAMAALLGAKLTTSLDRNCSDSVHDPRIRAAVGYVPYAGQSFLPAFCDSQQGAEGVNRPYLAISGTADTTAPIGVAQRAVNQFGSSRYLVQLIDGKHEFRPEDAGDLFTWTVTFLDAYLDVPTDPGAMARFIHMNGVTGGRDDSMVVDVHVPFANTGGDTDVVEFYNSLLGHYFMAAGAGEIDGIDHGAAGPGWERTGEAFKAWLTMPQDAFTLAVPVCRFYGTPAGGPNSHFFTASASECSIVKASGGWYYEGIGFYIRPVDPDGRCPDGYLEVSRAYNQGFPRNDSNHRFSTSDSTMAEMARKGWVVEGTVMCTLP
jgi:predicted dienelactone hydrolase